MLTDSYYGAETGGNYETNIAQVDYHIRQYHCDYRLSNRK
jgi:hypothetical protein